MKIIKRIIIFLAIIISVLWIEIVHADMSAPELRNFEIVVINPDGVNYYDYKGDIAGHLDKDDIVIVMYEYGGKYDIGIKEINQYGREYDKNIGYINSLNGFSIVQEEVDPTKITEDDSIKKLDSPEKARIYAEEGVDIYKGPSDVYEKVGHIKKDVILTYEYVVSSLGGGTTHIYVEYEGKKGWVEILQGKVLVQNQTQYIFANDVITECGTIPKNSITTPNFRTDNWKHDALFEYNGCEFLHSVFRDDDIFDIYSYTQKTNKEITLYENSDNTGNVIATIPKGSEVIVLASKDSIGEPEYVMYIKYNDKIGWTRGQGELFDYGSAPEELEEEIEIEDTIEVKEPEEIKPSQYEKKTGLSLPELIAICCIGGVLLVITAIVVIILINKNKVNKTNEQK